MRLCFHVQEEREEGREALLRGVEAPTVIYLTQTTVAAMALAFSDQENLQSRSGVYHYFLAMASAFSGKPVPISHLVYLFLL